MTRYQETYIRGPMNYPFQRECAGRYEPIKKALKLFGRAFSVLDIGANMGYFSVRIAEDFPHATVIAVDNKAELASIVRKNKRANCAVIPRRLSAADLAGLAECEAFDVVLALNVLHHMPHPAAALEAIRRLGMVVITETPGPDDPKAANPGKHAALDAALSGGEVLREARAHTGGARKLRREIGWTSKTFKRQSLDVDPSGYHLAEPSDYQPGAMRKATPIGNVEVRATYESSWFLNQRLGTQPVESRAFVPGINLWNFKLLGGVVPGIEDIEKRLKLAVGNASKDGGKLDDIRPWNFILSGEGVTPIDRGFKLGYSPRLKVGLADCFELLRK